MSDRTPPPELILSLAPIWVFFISAIGAAVGYLEDFKQDDTPRVMVFKALTRLFSSGFAAVLTWHAIQALGVPVAWHVPIVGISGHMGVESLKIGGEILRGWMNKRAGQGAQP